MDRVFIEGLRVDAVIGVFEWEKQVRQPLVFDLEMAWDIRQAAVTDDLAFALNYQAVTEYIEGFVREQHFQLLESLLERLSDGLLQEFGMPWLSIRVEKPAVVPQARAVGLKIERGVL
ncbi:MULTISPECIES: dihydroneopterin aldolase [unclassified Oceanobacter]|jgi:dihydroneopterin aldolase|uniref:dihydroneopterin aldolase n=1 Tax=unclassified Oceanobacter TaxID=2620260 RepID=UPI0026E2EDA3|nr:MULTISPECIES: dihydroneopterin aldolase [unclassified Oceanobacter]MDO6683136.1 dihydroneopterin aldolase [Oceanobacter sp. 5_MG-2023]MDP2506497.1 dihydroneopterin aldolase [Oceanobacter sp. 3_MG-2023]MDP2548917.1 dihydroneopterin aldolase [Oceanobacter sp. 4_MG-2023]MDP2610457.1 dihydroneopterin aldolase [Oceanobacter sp. 1_MG-2023]MDP2613694.1 dihydroneopterin aldolase [Oceanobacter sp. 2_MG-2023]